MAEAGDRAINQPRIDRRERTVADAEFVHHAGAKIFHHHVGLCRELFDDRDRFWLREVERQAALVAVDRLPARRETALRPFAAQRRATHILALAPLHLDDVSAEERELVARIGPRQHLREVENLYAFERSGQNVLLVLSLSLCGRGWHGRAERVRDG